MVLLGADRLHGSSRQSMRDDFGISCAELDVAIEVATTHGALGAQMTGGGFGGSAITLVPTESTGDVTSAVIHSFPTAVSLHPTASLSPRADLLSASPDAGRPRLAELFTGWMLVSRRRC